MRTKSLHIGTVAALILVSGCAYNSERAAKMSETGPKGTHQSDAEWYARCQAPTHNGAWRGPSRTTKAAAIRDAGAHEKENPGHQATVEH